MWKVEIGKQSEKFLDNNSADIRDSVYEKIRNMIEWLENKNNLIVDLKKLKGDYQGYYRIRTGKIRIIISIDKKNYIIKIQNINFRRNIKRNVINWRQCRITIYIAIH